MQDKRRGVAARGADSGDDPVRVCGCPGLQASRFLKKSCASCASMLIIPVNHEAVTPPSGSPAHAQKGSPRERGRPARTMPGTAWAISPHLDQPATAPWLSFGLAAAVTADVVAACKAARKLSDHQRDSMRAGRPRSRGQSLPLWRGSRRSRAGRRRLMRRGEPGRRRGIDIFL